MDTNKQKSIRGIARVLGLSTSNVSEFLKKPGAPVSGDDGYDLAEVAAFVKANAENSRTLQAVSEGFSDLRVRELKAKCEKLEFALAKERGEYVKMSDMLAEVTPTLEQFRQILFHKLENEMPIAAGGLGVPEARIYGGRLANELMKEFQKVFKAWKV